MRGGWCEGGECGEDDVEGESGVALHARDCDECYCVVYMRVSERMGECMYRERVAWVHHPFVTGWPRKRTRLSAQRSEQPYDRVPHNPIVCIHINVHMRMSSIIHALAHIHTHTRTTTTPYVEVQHPQVVQVARRWQLRQTSQPVPI